MSPYLNYSPIIDRAVIRWPNDARVALIVVPNIEHYEYMPPSNAYKNPFPTVSSAPDVIGYGTRDYGNRVGIWRMLDVFDKYNIRATCSLNAGVLELYPQITRAMLERNWTFMSHGIFNTQFLFGLHEDEEREFYRRTMAMVEEHTGQRMKGMLGPSFTASANTPRLMAEAGMIYTMDWFVDDQPFPLEVPSGQLVGVPYSRELNDSFVFAAHPFYGMEGDYFAQICMDQFDTLWNEGEQSGRVMTIAVHPYYIGMPHEIKYLDRVFEYIFGHDGVWATTADEVAEHYLAFYWDEADSHSSRPTHQEETARSDAYELHDAAATPESRIAAPPVGSGTMVTSGLFPELPIIDRTTLTWPEGARVAVCVLVHLDHVEWLPSPGSIVPPSVVRRRPYPEIPDIHETSPHEYGNRVGIFRIGDVLREVGLPATVAMDSIVADDYPFLVQHCLSQGWELIGHGVSGSRMISESLTEAQEREYIDRSIEAVTRAAGVAPRGWSGVDYQESSRTVRLLAERGIDYVMDWPNDEQPYAMSVAGRDVVSLPIAVHLDDVYSLLTRRTPVMRLEQMIIEAFDRLYADGQQTGRLLVIPIHPWVSGQPFRIGYLRRSLEHIMSHEAVWAATGSEIADWFAARSASAS